MARLLYALIILIVAAPAVVSAADLSRARRAPPATFVDELPFPRTERAQSVWASRACWRGCQVQCTWGLNACVNQGPQGECLAWTNGCDRSCQRQCRTMGGPYVNLFE